MKKITIKGKYADFTVKPAGGVYDVEVTMTGKRYESPHEATAFFTADEVEHIQAALTQALEAPVPWMSEASSRQFVRTTEELEEILEDEVGEEGSTNWDALASSLGEERMTLKKYVMHDDRVVLTFTNGRKVRLFHPGTDGDEWDVTPLGWG